jgi:hypothetical protein
MVRGGQVSPHPRDQVSAGREVRIGKTEAAAIAIDAPGAVPGSDEEARAHLADYLAEVLLLEQGTDAVRARAELGWQPSYPSLTNEFRRGSYRK